MLVSARGAAEILKSLGLGREEVRRLLRAGFAGPGFRTPSALLFDDKRVRDLASRPLLEDADVEEICPQSLFIGRIPRDREVDITAGWSDLADAVRGGWRLGPLDRILIAGRIERYGSMPFLTTLGGFVVAAAEAIDVQLDEAGDSAFTLVAPGSWADAFEGTRLLAGAGRSWFIRGWSRTYAE